MDDDELSQPVSGLFALRGPDYRQPASSGLERALRRELCRGGRRDRRPANRHLFSGHRLSPLEHSNLRGKSCSPFIVWRSPCLGEGLARREKMMFCDDPAIEEADHGTRTRILGEESPAIGAT